MTVTAPLDLTIDVDEVTVIGTAPRTHIHDGNDGNCPHCHAMMSGTLLIDPDKTASPYIACQWRGIPTAGVTADGPCNNIATLTGKTNESGEQHLCSVHLTARDRAGYGAYRYTYVWPCQANGFVYYRESAVPGSGLMPLPDDAKARCR